MYFSFANLKVRMFLCVLRLQGEFLTQLIHRILRMRTQILTAHTKMFPRDVYASCFFLFAWASRCRSLQELNSKSKKKNTTPTKFCLQSWTQLVHCLSHFFFRLAEGLTAFAKRILIYKLLMFEWIILKVKLEVF